MSTRSYIGIIKDKEINGIYCHYDGDLLGVGTMLYLFYNTEDKIRELLKRGNLSSLGINVNAPKLPINDYDSVSICHSVNSLFKTDYTWADADEHPERGVRLCAAPVRGGKVINSDYDFIYLYDKDRWLMISTESIMVQKGKVMYDSRDNRIPAYFVLDDLLDPSVGDRHLEKYRDEMSHFYTKDFIESLVERTRRNARYYKELATKSDIETCNYWIELMNSEAGGFYALEKMKPQKPVVGLEFGYSETKAEGKTYAIFKRLEDGESKRKCLMRSKNLNDLTLAVCQNYGINLYARPLFGKQSILN